jgi:hypothetical protein
LATLRGDREQAIGLLRSCVKAFETRKIRQEREHDCFALGLLLGGAEGAQLVTGARNELAASGFANPDASVRAYMPELFTH